MRLVTQPRYSLTHCVDFGRVCKADSSLSSCQYVLVLTLERTLECPASASSQLKISSTHVLVPKIGLRGQESTPQCACTLLTTLGRFSVCTRCVCRNYTYELQSSKERGLESLNDLTTPDIRVRSLVEGSGAGQ